MAHKGKFGLLLGLAAGIATGVLFSPTSGKKFRDKIKKDLEDGGSVKESLYTHFKSVAKEIKDTTKLPVNTKKLEKAFNNSKKIAGEAIKDIKSEFKDKE